MNRFPTRFILLCVALAFPSCRNQPGGEPAANGPGRDRVFVSMDGLWISTPETAMHFEPVTLKATVLISGSDTGEPTVRGCFTWEDRFRDYWWLQSIQVVDSTNRVIITDRDGSTYMGSVNKEKTRINGWVYSMAQGELVPEDRLDFTRASHLDTERLFTPRPPARDGSVSYCYREPEQLDDGLSTGSIFEVVKDSAALYSLMARLINQEFGRIESLLVLKDGKLVLEEYFYNYHRDEPHNVFSVTKSITSLVTGIALDAHHRTDVTLPLAEFFPGKASLLKGEKQQLNLEHLLTMTAGFAGDEEYEGLDQDHLLDHILGHPLESLPGEVFRYNSDCPLLLGGVIHALTGKTAEEYARERLFGPLEISEYQWYGENGVPFCHNGLSMLPRDMAKIGLLVLQDGTWNGRQIVPGEWIAASIVPHVPESPYFNYGYQWWHRSPGTLPWWESDGPGARPAQQERPAPEMALAMGFGGQYIFILKETDLVVVTTASDYNESTGMALKKIPLVEEELWPLFR